MSSRSSSGGLFSSPAAKHAFLCVAAPVWIVAFCVATGAVKIRDENAIEPFAEYNALLAVVLIAIRLVSFLGLPQTLFNLYGLLRFNAFPPDVRLKGSPLLTPFVCVRVVTRGSYPKLVRETVRKNLSTLSKVGFENYLLQVVTDIPIGLSSLGPLNRAEEVVVPSTYRTKSGALNKSRALQYCLEDDVNRLSADDWIVHLDEETLLTENSVRGILNFVSDGKHDFGQGLITYANAPLHFKSMWKTFQNRICTVADSFRVADDMGKLRCQFKVFHKPVFGFKGSYVVTRAGAEQSVGFDNGPEGSKAEDCFFAMLAMDREDKHHSFDFIEGEMHEKSPFTFSDFFKQRKRWMQGIYMVVASPRISWRTKGLLAMSLSAWLTLPLSTLNIVLSQAFPFTLGFALDFGLALLGAMGLLCYGFGYVKQHHIRRYSWYRLLLVIPEIVLSSALSIVVENCAVCTMWFGDWYDFYIVEKEADDDDSDDVEAAAIEDKKSEVEEV